MKRIIVNLIAATTLVVIICSCSNREETKVEQTPEKEVNTEVVDKDAFEELTFEKAKMPTQIKAYKGSIVDGKHWKDKNGDNYFILTFEDKTYNDREGTASLTGHGYHFCNNNTDEYSLVRVFNDFVKDCEFDLAFQFKEDYFTVQDLNNNQYGEVTVVYTVDCASDVSPLTMKLLLFENGEKYAIRGTTKDMYGNGGDMVVDKSFKSAENILKSNAITQFQRAAGIK